MLSNVGVERGTGAGFSRPVILEAPFLAAPPRLSAPRHGQGWWREAQPCRLELCPRGGGRPRPYEWSAGHDQTWLYLAIETPLRDTWDCYLTLHLDHAGALAAPCLRNPYVGLMVGCAGPHAWGGYNYCHLPSEAADLTWPPEAWRASQAVDDRVLFYLRLPLAALNVRPDGLLGFHAQAGDAGTSGDTEEIPEWQSSGTRRWAFLHLDQLWRDGLDLAACPLTRREREVLQQVADLGGGDRVARRLCLSRRTVEQHLASARRKLARSTTVECVTEAIRQGWIA